MRKIAASVLSKLFTIGNENCHTTDAPYRVSGTLYSDAKNILSNIPEDQKKLTTQWTHIQWFLEVKGSAHQFLRRWVMCEGKSTIRHLFWHTVSFLPSRRVYIVPYKVKPKTLTSRADMPMNETSLRQSYSDTLVFLHNDSIGMLVFWLCDDIL